MHLGHTSGRYLGDFTGARTASSVSSAEKDITILSQAPTLTAEQERKLWLKIDLRLLPILSLMFLMSNMDRGNIGNAKLEGLVTQLHLTGHRYNTILTAFLVPYCALQCLSNIVLKKFRPSRWLPGITTMWGIFVMATGFVKNYHELLCLRVLLALAEAGLIPGVLYYLTLWYPRDRLQTRIAIFIGGPALAGAFSGLIAYGISFMSGTRGYLGWSWILILEGAATVVVGIIGFFVMVDLPADAGFLTPQERAFVVHKKKYDNSSLGEEEHFEIRHLWATLLDWQVWLHIFIFMSFIAPVNGLTYFLPTLINNFGFSAVISQLLTIPPYLTAFVLLYSFAYFSDRIQLRSPFMLAGQICCVIGFAVCISNISKGVNYMGIFWAVAGCYSGIAGATAWLGTNVAGHYKRGMGIALQLGVGNVASIVIVNVYRAQDAPRFILGHAIELMFVGVGMICVSIAVVSYKLVNRHRDELLRETLGQGGSLDAEELMKLGDKSPDFRYVL
ncbi:hypothetical protein APHAL10511_004031 [Amanita phalloides]|nr:hypothetical protein APHAL10511_004031 [Amanita phalloides]